MPSHSVSAGKARSATIETAWVRRWAVYSEACTLVNARTHAPGSPIHISSQRIGDRVPIQVSDLGPGIADRDTDRIFERGTRGPTSAGTLGSGLGLHIASQLVHGMGGRLGVCHGQAESAAASAVWNVTRPDTGASGGSGARSRRVKAHSASIWQRGPGALARR